MRNPNLYTVVCYVLVPFKDNGERENKKRGGEISEDDEQQRFDAEVEDRGQENHVSSIDDLDKGEAGDDKEVLGENPGVRH